MRLCAVQVVLCATNMVVIKGSEATFDAFSFSLGRFCIAALAFAPFLAEGLADEALWAPAAELGLWMGASAAELPALDVLLWQKSLWPPHRLTASTVLRVLCGVQAWATSRKRR